MLSKTALIIFIRKPELGKVKTRLAAEVGDVQALDIYVALHRHTCIVASDVDVERYLYYTDKIDQDDDWPQSQYHKRVQCDGTLGDKLVYAFDDVLSRHDKAIVIGSDCAQLRPSHIIEAISALDYCDVVMGPSLDGGYYLLGMKRLHQELFSAMPWSTDQVASITRARISSLGLTAINIEVLSDIDHKSDWEQYGLDYILT